MTAHELLEIHGPVTNSLRNGAGPFCQPLFYMIIRVYQFFYPLLLHKTHNFTKFRHRCNCRKIRKHAWTI